MSDALMWQTGRARSIRANREVGAAIRLARENRGWRLADVAARTGYSVSTLSRVETSRRPPTDLVQIRRIAGAVGIPLGILGELLGMSPPAGATVDGSGEFLAEESDVRRRELLAAASLAVPAVILAGMDEALAIMPEPSAPVTAVSVSTCLARLREQYDSGSLARVIGGASRPALLGEFPGPDQPGSGTVCPAGRLLRPCDRSPAQDRSRTRQQNHRRPGDDERWPVRVGRGRSVRGTLAVHRAPAPGTAAAR